MARSAESLFREVFLPLYPPDARDDLARARRQDENPGRNPTILGHLDDAAAVFVQMAHAALGCSEAELALDFGDASVHRLSAALTPARIDALLAGGPAGTADNVLFNFVVHGAAYVGACIVRNHGGAWAVRRPLWESLVALRSRAGEAELAVFHWWLKSLAEPAFEAGGATLADRYRAHVEIPCMRPEDLPVIAPADRSLPRIGKVRYDVLYKYLRANLPELKDVGDHFPSPERFEELGFAHLSCTLVGEGRMLVMHGPGKGGLHAFWLTKSGFEKSAFWPCDSFPEPIFRRKGDHLEVVLAHDGQSRAFELLWWGP